MGCSEYLSEICDAHLNARSVWTWYNIRVNWFQSAYTSHAWDSEWRMNVYLALSEIRNMLINLITGHPASTSKQNLCLFLTNCVGGGDVDMDALLNAMLAASFEQLTQWMGITQAYKSAVWDAPFNEEFYAALARGFKKW